MKTTSLLVLLPLCLAMHFCFSCEESNDVQSSRKIDVVTLKKTTMNWQGDQLPQYPEGQPEVTLVKITVPPGLKFPEHIHPVMSVGFVAKGQIQVTDTETGKTNVVRAGECKVELINKRHFCENIGQEDAESFVFFAGIENTPVTVLVEGNS